ncbi:VWA domain-containing protein [Streptosporangium sp. NBC_01755]|uniref:vWA domain-containing protein n=1 Tax=Streptosporangium sp. NBC_01755 TaxID=2975949 RepID=UPI002DDB5ABC|nr:vWA domain-containing protein [Streptosporangium sp. NBC_01755]WSD03805.1 VWA domain-containing protein [Streptosporangium sp. NBC_01755]
MTNSNLRHIVIILDRSGSMALVKDDTEGGLKAFLAEQINAPSETTVSLYQFDDRYEIVYENTPLADVPDFALKPRGMTALLDAVGMTINRVGGHLATLPEDSRPGEVVAVILTDGAENSSKEYTLPQVKDLITRQRDTYGWAFVFLGADQDAFAAAGGMGIGRASTLSYGSNRTEESMTRAGAMVTRGSRTGDYTFTDDDRDATSA